MDNSNVSTHAVGGTAAHAPVDAPPVILLFLVSGFIRQKKLDG